MADYYGKFLLFEVLNKKKRMEERNEKSKKEERKEKRKNEEKKERQLCNPVTFCLTSKEDFSLLQVIHLCTCYEISIVSKLIACTGKERMAS